MIEVEVRDGIKYLKNTNIPMYNVYITACSEAPTSSIAKGFGITEEQVHEIYAYVLREKLEIMKNTQ